MYIYNTDQYRISPVRETVAVESVGIYHFRKCPGADGQPFIFYPEDRHRNCAGDIFLLFRGHNFGPLFRISLGKIALQEISACLGKYFAIPAVDNLIQPVTARGFDAPDPDAFPAVFRHCCGFSAFCMYIR
ncbi:hypothetical protein QUF80_20225 [Desulfococcaceae bacterium HSG8]|nr:hypothetical protein [Desulfococcaceae bacterium HSG8]